MLILCCIYESIDDYFWMYMKACDGEEDGIFGFDMHSDGDGQRYVSGIFLKLL